MIVHTHCADRRDAEGQKALFTKDTRHLFTENGDRKIMIASLRYLDTVPVGP
jgi:hypothetical protein